MQKKLLQFRNTVWSYYRSHKRTLPWRTDHSPYAVVVSEFMLQQTQVQRVIPYFVKWMDVFPTLQALADSPFPTVLHAWQGLGYNRRAKYLHSTAYTIHHNYKEVPSSTEILVTLPGIGSATAEAIRAYAYNIPTVFIETNIRTVFIHHFFPKNSKVKDENILELVKKTLPEQNVREWYWALMDYGSYLKKKNNNVGQSAHYKKQSAFRNSTREKRGRIIKEVLENGIIPVPTDESMRAVADGLIQEEMLELTQKGIVVKQ